MRITITALLLSFLSSGVMAQSAKEIMTKVDYVNRKSYDTQIAKIKLTTCPYRLIDGKQRCTSRPRVVIIENSKAIKNLEDTHARSLAVVSAPISDKGISMLTFEYEKRGLENDNWLYLTALGKVKRVISSGDDAGTVFGSEFSVENTENPEARRFWEYDYKLIGDEKMRGRDTWVIEMIPTKEKAERTRYTKIVAWIDKEKYFALAEEYYRGNQLHKRRTQEDIEKIDGVWMSRKVTMNNLTENRVSRMDKPFIAFNVDIDDELLTQRALTDFAFRERNLEKQRKHMQQ